METQRSEIKTSATEEEEWKISRSEERRRRRHERAQSELLMSDSANSPRLATLHHSSFYYLHPSQTLIHASVHSYLQDLTFIYHTWVKRISDGPNPAQHFVLSDSWKCEDKLKKIKNSEEGMPMKLPIWFSTEVKNPNNWGEDIS